ncbi:MAG: shikimate dehydrogenase [Alphaproteobacteria bacterium]
MKKAGVIGYPIHHSISPKLHGFWLKKYGIEGEYTAYEVKPENLGDFIKSLKEKGLNGCNVTIPHKEDVMQYLDVISEDAQKIGAVNTVIVNSEGKTTGYNTDVCGFVNNLKNTVPNYKFSGKAIVLGAGGAARAICVGLLKNGVSEVFLTDIAPEKAEKIAADLKKGISVLAWEERESVLKDVMLVVNATPLGMKGFPEHEINLTALSENAVVYDIVYTPEKTGLLKKAEEQNNPILGGLGMLIQQAVYGFENWFGQKPVPDQEIESFLRKEIER